MSHEPVPHSRRQFLGASLAGLGAMSATRLSHGKSPETHSRPRKKLIGWGSDIANPGKVQNNIRKIEELPLDGIVLSNFSGTQGGKEFTFDWECFGKQKYERKQLADTRAQCSESPTGWLPSSAARASECWCFSREKEILQHGTTSTVHVIGQTVLRSGADTAGNSLLLKFAAVASPASREKLPSTAAVKSTDRSSGQ